MRPVLRIVVFLEPNDAKGAEAGPGFLPDFLAYHGALVGREHIELVVPAGMELPTAWTDGGIRVRAFENTTADSLVSGSEWTLVLRPDQFLLWAGSAENGTTMAPATLRMQIQAYLAMIHGDIGVLQIEKRYGSCVCRAHDEGYADGMFARPAAQMTCFERLPMDAGGGVVCLLRGTAGRDRWMGLDMPNVIQGNTSQLAIASFGYRGVRAAYEDACVSLSKKGLISLGEPLHLILAKARVATQSAPEARLFYLVALRQFIANHFRHLFGRLPGWDEMLTIMSAAGPAPIDGSLAALLSFRPAEGAVPVDNAEALYFAEPDANPAAVVRILDIALALRPAAP